MPVVCQVKQKYRITQTKIDGTNIRCLSEDSKGFLWIGTQDGLFRFDSKTAKLFNKSGLPKNNIGGTDIRDLRVSPETIWITSTHGGIDQIEIATANPVLHLPQTRFPGLDNSVITSLLDVDTILFAGTEKGLYQFNINRNQISRINLDSLTGSHIDKISRFHHFLILFIRNRGCLSYDLKKDKIVGFIETINPLPTQTHRFYSIAHYSEQEWVLGTSRGIHLVSIQKDGQLQFNRTPFPYSTPTIGTDIYAISVDQDQNIWFSNENHLLKLEPKTRQTLIIENALENTKDFLNNVYKIYCDKENNLWLGCQTGLFYLKNSPSPSNTYYRSSKGTSKIAHAYYLFPVNDSSAFVTAENGLYHVNTNTRVIEEVDITQVYDFIFYDPHGNLIVSNKSGLHLLREKHLIPLHRTYPEFTPFPDYTINSAVPVNNSEIVMGTENNKGILIWNHVSQTVLNLSTASVGLKLDNNIINTVFKIRDNIFCVLTESSLLYIDWKKNICKRIHLMKTNSSEEFGLFFDMCRFGNSYYLSSYGNGVLELDSSFAIKSVISTATGLSNNSVYKLLPWKDSLLFMTTNFGLNILNAGTGEIEKLYKSDGLHDDVFEETSGSIYKNAIYAGGQNGFTIINPENLRVNKRPPLLYLDKITLDFPGNIFTDTSNLSVDKFYIPNNILQTTIYFSGINFSNPERTTYTYKISELHKDWISLDNRNFVTLIGLSPGTYHFSIKAANENNLWSDPKEITLVFLPKWYQTWWFKLLLVTLVIASVYGLYQIRINQIKNVHKIRNKLAGDLHDDLGSTMNSAKIYASLAMLEKEPAGYLIKVKESIQEAITGIRDMIWVLDDNKDKVEHLLARVNNFAAPLCEANNIRYKLEISDIARDHKLGQEERRNLYMMLKEAINNAIKYSAGETIELEIFLVKGKPELQIRDNGKGFDCAHLTEGNGLKNMNRRAKEIGYIIRIESMPGKGTTINLKKI